MNRKRRWSIYTIILIITIIVCGALIHYGHYKTAPILAVIVITIIAINNAKP